MVLGTISRMVQIEKIPKLTIVFCWLFCFAILLGASLSFSRENGKPLFIYFVDTNNVLNDGKSISTLRLRIKNISGGTLVLNKAGNDKPGTEIKICCETQDDGEYKPSALGTKNQVAAIKLKVENTTDWKITPTLQDSSPFWTLFPKDDQEIKADQSIEITLSNIKTDLPSGPTKLYVNYTSISGHENDSLVATIEKGPVVYKGDKTDVKIGIGTAEPEAKLHVKGNSNIEGTVTASAFHGDGMVPKGVIVMWSGTADTIPAGWALCNGDNNTPDLHDRFIVGASESLKSGEHGEPDQHSHNATLSGFEVFTSRVEDHKHLFPSKWKRRNYKGSADKGGHMLIDTWGDKPELGTSMAGAHSHNVTIPEKEIIIHKSEDQNRPRWYALCFIMKQ